MPLAKKDVVAYFTERFGQTPTLVVRAPGRVNLIGEHTDYNDGFVLPLAIDRAVWIALRPRSDCRVKVYSIDYQEAREFDIANLKHEKAGWIEYLKGVAWCLQDAGMKLQGWEGVLAGDVPLGAGLSSSAALEMATARAFAAVSDIAWDAVAQAKLGQRSENKWIGVNCGIMDQLISSTGLAGHATLIDCRSLELQPAPLPAGVAVVVLDTATRRGLVDSAYNERRSQCESAAAFFQVKALRDVTMAMFDAKAGELDATTRRRARHVISEDDRTTRAVEAMRRGDIATLGRLMNESHASLRDDYDVSSDALNVMVEAAQAHEACYGARMTGAGFGGCAVAIVRMEAADDFVAATSSAYQAKTGNKPAVYVCSATDGAALV
ncbi:MAG: galactokinase [Planctomycetota bacterium]